MGDAGLIRRAMAAWYRSGGIHPPNDRSGTVTVRKLRYVRLFGGPNVEPMAIYRVHMVKGQPMLRRLKRWPSEVGMKSLIQESANQMQKTKHVVAGALESLRVLEADLIKQGYTRGGGRGLLLRNAVQRSIRFYEKRGTKIVSC